MFVTNVDNFYTFLETEIHKFNKNIFFTPMNITSNNINKHLINYNLDSINKIADGTAKFEEQDHSVATYAKKISKAEGKIHWNIDAKKILAKINGLNPNPGAWFEYKKERFKVWKAEIANGKGKPGKTLDDKLTIACNEGSIKILEIQKEGKSRQEIDQFLLGNKIKHGENIV